MNGIIAGRWEITGVLGEGGTGDVYRGLDHDTGETVAIKLLKPDIVEAAPGLLDRFKREIDLLRQLNHPNIVRSLGAVDEDDLHYLIIEYVPGGSLRDLLRVAPLPAERVLEIALDLADALTRAHRLHIIHRDLKPGNVLIAGDGTPRLTDFGMAHVAGATSITHNGMLIGTPGYISPEACRGLTLDARSDIWSFGVMLYEMLAGFNPFERGQIAATITAILTESPPDLDEQRPDAPVALVDLINRMLEKDPDYRMSSMRFVGAELEAILSGGREPAHPARSLIGSAASMRAPGAVRAMFKPDLYGQLMPFVGRESEIEALDNLLREPFNRLVTIAAPGGMGKTRLAVEYATRQVGKFAGGVYLIPLSGLSRTEEIVLAIADAVHFGFAPMRDRQEQLLSFLGGSDEQPMLLVMDNFEHVLDSAPLVAAMLRASPGIRFLTTSRERLNLSEEVVFELGGMEIPEGLSVDDACRHGTLRLFEASARRILPGYELRAADVPPVLRICGSVFGNPLGIVLAGAWIEMLSPDEIAHEVEISLDFLQTDARDVPERQRSLRALFESSWSRLSDTERDAFMKLSIFRGGVKRTIAQYITGASLQTLAALVKKSLVRRDPDSGRYQVHELLRQYAAEALDESGKAQATRDIHAHFFISLVARHTPNLRGQDQAGAIREIDADFENVRSAWLWVVQRKNLPMIAMALEGVALFCLLVGEFEEMAVLMREARTRLASTPGESPDPLWRQAAIRLELAQTPHADRAQIEMLLDMARAEGDRAEEAFCLWTLGYALSAERRYADAVPVFRASLAIYQEIGDPFFTGRTMGDAGLFSAIIGQHAESVGLLQQSAHIQETIGDAAGYAQSRLRMALNLDFLIASGLMEMPPH